MHLYNSHTVIFRVSDLFALEFMILSLYTIIFLIFRYTTVSYRAPEMVDLYSETTISTKADIWVNFF